MFDAYSIAIKISMINAVSPQLSILQKQFGMLGAEADAFALKLNKIKSMAMIGGVMFGAGAMGIGALVKMSKPAQDYLHQLNAMKLAGMTNLEITQATGAAWLNTQNNLTTTATGNLKALADLRQVLGDTHFTMALEVMPLMTKIETSLASEMPDKNIYGMDMVKQMSLALAQIGANENTKKFETQALLMGQAMVGTQMRVTPATYGYFFKKLQQTRYTLDDYFKYRIAPTLLEESMAGGQGTRGVSYLTSQIRQSVAWGVQGSVNRKSLIELGRLGLVDPNSAISTTTTGTTVDAFKNYKLLMKDSFSWFETTLKPAIIQLKGINFYKSNDDMVAYLLQLARGNAGFSGLMTEYYHKEDLLYKNALLYSRAAMGPQGYEMAAENDPQFAYYALGQQWKNLQTSLLIPVVKLLIPTLIVLTHEFSYLSNELIKFPAVAKYLVFSFLGLSSALMFGGVVILLKAAFEGLWFTLSVGRLAFAAIAPAMYASIAPLLAFVVPIIGIVAAITVVVIAFNGLINLLDLTDKQLKIVKISFAALAFALLLGGSGSILLITSALKGVWFVMSAVTTFGIIPLTTALWAMLAPIVAASLPIIGMAVGITLVVIAIKKLLDLIHTIAPASLTKFGLSPALATFFGSDNKPTNKISPIATTNNTNNQHHKIVMHVNGQVLGQVALNHIAKQANKMPNHTTVFDTAMTSIPVMLQATGYL